MEIEQLKLILEVVGQAAEGAIWVAVLYFMIPLIKSLVYAGVFFAVVRIAINGLKHVLVPPVDKGFIQAKNISQGDTIKGRKVKDVEEGTSTIKINFFGRYSNTMFDVDPESWIKL